MSFEAAKQVADALLFEGYVLYPYRASAAKNQVRWQFGVLAPKEWAASGGEHAEQQTQCLLEADDGAALELRVRFLHVQAKIVEAAAGSTGEKFTPVETLNVDGTSLITWEEAVEHKVDVAVPVEKAFKTWTQFEEFPKFMHRVLDVDQEEDSKIHWREKIWFSTREWDGEITDKRQNDRIAWKSVSGTQHSGVISFHRLDKNLTRVLVTVDFVPSGMIEKMASGMRFVRRAVEADLARFKAYVEFGDAKGLEYRSQPEEMEQHRDGDDEDEAQSRSESRDDEKKSSDSDDRDRDSERRERENRRNERREALPSS